MHYNGALTAALRAHTEQRAPVGPSGGSAGPAAAPAEQPRLHNGIRVPADPKGEPVRVMSLEEMFADPTLLGDIAGIGPGVGRAGISE